MRFRLAILIALVVGGSLARAEAPPTLPALTAGELARGYRQGYILAKPKAECLGTVDAAEATQGVKPWRKFNRFGGLRVLALQPGDTPEAAIQRLAATGLYEYVEPDYVRHALATPNDPDFNQQWALNNTVDNPGIPGPGAAGADIHAEAAWNIRTSAANVIVAVIDTGARLTHTDLAANLWTNPEAGSDGYGDDIHGINTTNNGRGAGDPTDDEGHGTHVSGIIGAVGNNGNDVSGVAWSVQLMELKFLGADGEGSTVSNEITCIDYAISHVASLINASYGGSQNTASEYTAIQAAGNAGIIFVAGAGNNSSDNDLAPFYPASYLLDNIVAVGCSDNRDQSVFFTDYGSGLVDLFAPGYNILSLYDTNDTATAILSGTSMSTPFVTGSLALLKAQFPTDTYRQLINRLLSSVDANPDLIGKAQTAGRLDLATALGPTSSNVPFNDNFSARAHLAGASVFVRSNNGGATRETGEPVISGNNGGASLWWDWTAPVSGTVTISTAGSAYNTLVAVYTGTSLPSLVLVASNLGSFAGGGTITFPVQAGTTYEITVDGQNGASGLTLFNLQYTNDAFASPITLTGLSSGLTASNLNATREAGEPTILGHAGGYSVWYTWTAPISGQFQFTAYSYDFDPLLAVYTGTSLSSLTSVTSAAGTTGTSSYFYTLAASSCTCTFNATAGTTYFITVDGTIDANTELDSGQFTLSFENTLWEAATTSPVTCSPAVGSDGSVYVGSTDGIFYAYNPDGSKKWTYTSGNQFDTASAALSADGAAVYAGAINGILYALNTATGAVNWTYGTTSGSPIACSPAVGADGTIYFRDSTSSLYALTPAGGLKWTYFIPGISYSSPSIAVDGTLYIGADDGNLYALTPGTSSATLKWTFSTNTSSVPNNAIYTSPAIDSDGNIYFGTLSGAFYAVDPTGKQLWMYQASNSVSSSPALSAEGGVYFGCYDHKIYALNTTDGSVQWTYQTGNQIRASTPAIDSNGLIYVGSYDNEVYALKPNGTLNRIFASGDWVRSSPVISGTTMYFTSNDHQVYAVDIGASASPTSPWPMYMANARRTGQATVNPPTLLTQPLSQTVTAGASVTFTASATGGGLSYQWYFDGTAIPGATNASLTLSNVGTTQAGTYSVTASNTAGTISSNTATLAVPYNARLINLSVNTFDGLIDTPEALTVGFVSGGAGTTGSQRLLIRADGPVLAGYGVPTGFLPDPQLTVLNGSTQVATNAGWGTPSSNVALVQAAEANTFAFAFPNSTSLDSAVVVSLSAAGYTVQIAGKSGDTGTVVAEIYDDTTQGSYTSTTPRLINLSCKLQVAANGILTEGFTVGGTTSETVLIRASGPALTAYGVTGVMPDPQLTLFNSSNVPIAHNVGWGGNPQLTAAMTVVHAFPYTDSTSTDSALLVTLPPGSYTAQGSSVTGTSGTALIEVYEVP